MKILLAIDGSPFSDKAVMDVANKPWPAGSEVRIVSVVEPILMPTVDTWIPPDNYIEDLEKAGDDQARSIVNRAAERVRKAQGNKLRVSTEIVRGHPKYAIIDEAEACGSDLIVVGSHGYRGLTKLWLGLGSPAGAPPPSLSVPICRRR